MSNFIPGNPLCLIDTSEAGCDSDTVSHSGLIVYLPTLLKLKITVAYLAAYKRLHYKATRAIISISSPTPEIHGSQLKEVFTVVTHIFSFK
jgi:hypothetical protein